MPRFAANLSMMYTEHSFMERFAAAAADGFGAVEFLCPYDGPAATIAAQLKQHGLQQVLFIAPPGDFAGGETSGACVQALGIRRLRIGAQIDPGVPWCHAESIAAGAGGLRLALKSGNFGGVDFFSRAFEVAS